MEESVEITRTVHPMPDELEKMTEEETVCSFCGISYLIHLEVARLKDELEETKNKMSQMEEDVQNTQKLKEEIKSLKQSLDESHDIKSKYQKIGKLTDGYTKKSNNYYSFVTLKK